MNSNSDRPYEVKAGFDSMGHTYLEFGNNPTHAEAIGLLVTSLDFVISQSRTTRQEVEDLGVEVAGLLADNVVTFLQAERDNRADA